jgi:hypothetical protein
MQMKRLNGGSLRAAGYDEARRTLVVELTSGTFEYAGVSQDTWRRLASSSSPWSFFRDNIEEEFTAKRIR